MSLLDKASLVITPNAVKTGKLYSVVPNTTLGDMTVVRGTIATRVNSAGLIESVGVNIPRIDYTNVSCPTLLVEPLRTNLALNNDGNLSTYPTAINVTNASSSFNSFVNAIQFPNTGLALAYKSVSTTVQTYAISAFIKMDDNSVPILSASATTGNVCLVIAGNVATNNLKVESYGNNVYRLSATATSSGSNNNNGVLRYDTQVLKSFKITGIQLEVGSYATSYVPTVAASVTRNADVISKTGISSLIGQTEGTIYYEFSAPLVENITRALSVSGSDTNNRINISTFSSSIFVRVDVGGANQVNSSAVITVTNMNKVAFRYKANDFSLYVNGVNVITDTSGITFPAATLDRFSNIQPDSSSPFNGNIKQVTFFKTALSNSELAQLTTI